MKIKSVYKLFLLLFSTVLLAACQSGSGTDDTPQPQEIAETYLRAIHASPDAPNVDIYLDDQLALADVGYEQASGFITAIAGMSTIKINVAGTETTAIEADLNLVEDEYISVFALNNLDSIEPFILMDTNTPAGEGFFKLKALHASPNVPEVDIYVTAPGADITMTEPALSNIPFKGNSGYLDLPEGEYQVRITLAGTKTAAYDSGPLDLPEGLILTAAAIETDEGPSPVKLMVLTNLEESPVLLFSDYRAEVRIVHASSDAPAVDILVDDATALEDVAYQGFSGYLELTPGARNFKVNAANTDLTVIDVTPELMPEKDYTVIALNELENIEPLLLEDDNTLPGEGNFKLRLIHAAQQAGTVDVYLTGADDSIDMMEPSIAGFEFKANSGYLEFPAGTYRARITLPGTKTVAIDTGAITFEPGQIRTAIARDPANEEDGFGVILLEDRN